MPSAVFNVSIFSNAAKAGLRNVMQNLPGDVLYCYILRAYLLYCGTSDTSLHISITRGCMQCNSFRRLSVQCYPVDPRPKNSALADMATSFADATCGKRIPT